MNLVSTIVGAGLMGKFHALALNRYGVPIASFVDVDLPLARKLANRFGSLSYSSLSESLANTECDVVHICSPLTSHYDLAYHALTSGKHVLMEKPLTFTAIETAKLLSIAADNGVLLCPTHQFCFQRGTQKTMELLSRTKDTPSLIEFHIASAGGNHSPLQESNEIVTQILPHPFSVADLLFPLAESYNHEWNIRWIKPGEMLAFGLHGDIPISIYISLHARPTQCSMKIFRSSGTIEQNFFHGYTVVDSSVVSRMRKITSPFSHASNTLNQATKNLAIRAYRHEWAYPGLYTLITDFYQSTQSRVSILSSTHCLNVARQCDQFRNSATGAIE